MPDGESSENLRAVGAVGAQHAIELLAVDAHYGEEQVLGAHAPGAPLRGDLDRLHAHQRDGVALDDAGRRGGGGRFALVIIAILRVETAPR